MKWVGYLLLAAGLRRMTIFSIFDDYLRKATTRMTTSHTVPQSEHAVVVTLDTESSIEKIVREKQEEACKQTQQKKKIQ
jgi:hypothetical protein